MEKDSPLCLPEDQRNSAASPVLSAQSFFLGEIYVLHWSVSHLFRDTESIKKKNLALNDMSH